MGQYFKAINIDKREVVCPWCIGGFAKLWEWAANPWGAIFTLLLRRSDASGGGDYYGRRTSRVLEGMSPDGIVTENDGPGAILEAIQLAASQEGRPAPLEPESVVGRWAGDRVMLIGDYDSSKLWEEAKVFRNISEELVEAWNPFIGTEDRKLTFNPNCGCNKDQ